MSDPIDKHWLKSFLFQLETQAHYLYALMTGVPKANCYILRYYAAVKTDTNTDSEGDTFSVREFLDRFDTFDECDEFAVYYALNEDCPTSTEGCDMTGSLGCQSEATVSNSTSILNVYLRDYCEDRLRANQPLELTPAAAARFGFTSEDCARWRELLESHNSVARKLLCEEFDALYALDFIRERLK